MSQYTVDSTASGVGIVETLTGNTGGAVPPTGGNINVIGSGSVTVSGDPGTSTLTITAGSSTAQQYRYVAAQTGSDVTGTGSAINPWQTLTFAMTSITTASASNPFCIYAIGIFAENVAVKPFTTILGSGTKTTRINGILSLDSSWDTINGSFSLIDLYVQEIDFDSSGFASGTVNLYVSGILQGTGTENFSLDAGTNTGFIEIRNSSLSGNWILSDYTLSGYEVDFFVFSYDRPNATGGIFSTLYNCVCAAGSPVPSISSSGGAVLFFILNDTRFSQLEVNADVNLSYDAVSYPSSGFVFSGNGTASQTICSPGIIPHTSVTAATYTVLDSDYYLACNRAGTIALTFPAATGSGRTIIIKDVSGAAATNNITAASSGATFDGDSTLTLNTNYASVTCTDTATNVWSLS